MNGLTPTTELPRDAGAETGVTSPGLRAVLVESWRALTQLPSQPRGLLDWLRFAVRTQLALAIVLPALWLFGSRLAAVGLDMIDPEPRSWHRKAVGFVTGERSRRADRLRTARSTIWAVGIGGLTVLALLELPSALDRARRRRAGSAQRAGEIIAGRYQLLERIAEGGSGTVFTATDLVLERQVALKALHVETSSGAQDAEEIGRFRDEAHALARVSHPNIVQVFDLVDASDGCWIAMEYMGGGDLATLVEREGPMPWSAALEIVGPLANALDHIHELGIVHRDIKPLNVLLSADGTPKLADFGLAKSRRSSVVTRADVVMGSPAYLSPERVEGAEAGPESDVYALGALLYELLTGQPPFTGDARDVLVQHVIGEPVPPDRLAPSPLPPGTQALVLSMLAKDPAARPKGLRAVLQKWTS